MRSLCSLLLLLLMTGHSFAAPIELPLGGIIAVDLKSWDVQKIPTSAKTLMFLNKKVKGLQGILFDGTIKDQGLCDSKSTTQSWTVCDRKVNLPKEISFQIMSQRMIGPKVFQTYIYSFNYPKDKENEYLPHLKEFSDFIRGGK